MASDSNKGRILVSDPSVADTIFQQSVIYLTEDNAEGAVGFILNKPLELTLSEVLDLDTTEQVPLFAGGPVGQDTLHFLHNQPDLIEGGQSIGEGVYWGGDFERVKFLCESNLMNLNGIKFFVGYSGWGSGQLQQELEGDSWLVTPNRPEVVFERKASTIWNKVVSGLGGRFKYLANSPIDPQLN